MNVFEEMLELASDYPDFYLMKREDMAGTDKDTKTYFTIGTEFFKTAKALSALQHRFAAPMQLMGLNGTLTRVAIQGIFSLEDILLGIKKINTVVFNSIKQLAFQNKIHHFGPPESKNSWSAPTYQPHYSKYVIAVTGFPCPLNEAEIETYFDEAGVKVKGASFSWLATATEGEYVLQIQTTDPEQIRQLRDKEGKRHDSTFFLQWTLDLANTLMGPNMPAKQLTW